LIWPISSSLIEVLLRMKISFQIESLYLNPKVVAKALDEKQVGSGESIIRTVTLYPSSATHSVLGKVRRELLYADNKYVRMDTGDILTLIFPYVSEVGTTRDFIFVAEGFYTLPEK